MTNADSPLSADPSGGLDKARRYAKPAKGSATQSATVPGRKSGSRSTALRLLWAGQSTSLIGDQVTVLALPLLALSLGASTAQVTFVAGATRLPFLLLGLPAGVWVSRLGLRRSMLIADVLRALALLSLPLAEAFADLAYLQLLLVATVLGCGAVLFQVAYQSITPLLVADAAQLRSANTWLSASDSVALIGGPALAGVLAGTLGALRALTVDAASFFASVGTVALLRAPADQRVRPTATARSQMQVGIRFVLANVPLRAILYSSVLYNIGVAGYEALIVIFAVHNLGMSPTVLGLILALGGAGVPVGLLASKPVERRIGVGRVLIVSAGFSGLGLLVAGSAAAAFAVPILAAGTFVTAFGGGAWGLTALTTRQAISPPELRPMTTAVHRWASYGALPIGALVAAATASTFGVRFAMLLCGAIAMLGVLPLLRSSLPQLKAVALTVPGSDELTVK